MELRAPAVGPARAYIRSAGLTGNPSKRWRSGRGDLRRPGPPLGAEVPSVRGRDSSGKMGGVHVKVVGRWGGSGVGGRDVRVGRGRVEDWLATARLRGVQSGCTACRVVARRAGWLHGVQGGCSACRVVARRAGWLHGVQGGCMACRVVARRAGWLHGVQGGCTACRVVAWRAGWLHGVQGGCTACRVVARRAARLHRGASRLRDGDRVSRRWNARSAGIGGLLPAFGALAPRRTSFPPDFWMPPAAPTPTGGGSATAKRQFSLAAGHSIV